MSTETPLVKEGDVAPTFSLMTDEDKTVSLSDYRGKKVVLYFYPKDDTPGCTKESCSFRDHIKEIEGTGAVVLGVSRDSAESHRHFKSKFSLPYTLLVDEGAKVSSTYNVYKMRNLYGKESMGIERSTFIIDEDGKVKKVFRKVNVDGHTDEVLAALD